MKQTICDGLKVGAMLVTVFAVMMASTCYGQKVAVIDATNSPPGTYLYRPVHCGTVVDQQQQ